MKKQQKKEAGFIVSAELVLIATILVIGLIVGMVAIRDQVTAEMKDVAEAIGSLDQSYTFNGIVYNPSLAQVAGSVFSDSVDVSAGDGATIDYTQPPGNGEQGLP